MIDVQIIGANTETISSFAICGYKDYKNECYVSKVQWARENFPKGLQMKFLYSEKDGAVGGIEYMPGENAWKPVEADHYLVIHCLYIMSRPYKGHGYGRLLLESCLDEAKAEGKAGVVSIARKGTWMPGKEIFIKNGFKEVETAKPDFSLMVNKLDETAPDPCFSSNWTVACKDFQEGIHVFSSNQCPYLAKSVKEIIDVSREMKIKVNWVHMKTSSDIKKSPCPFGTFCLVVNGRVEAANPIGKTRFINIIKSKLKV